MDGFRYFNTGNGYIIYSPTKEAPGTELEDAKCVVGTGFDKIVLTVAMSGGSSKSSDQ